MHLRSLLVQRDFDCLFFCFLPARFHHIDFLDEPQRRIIAIDGGSSVETI
jgi:hypothetical protein